MTFESLCRRSFVLTWAAVFLTAPGLGWAEEPGKAGKEAAEEERVSTATYDISDIVAKWRSWGPAQQGQVRTTDLANATQAAEALCRTLLEDLIPSSPGGERQFLGKNAPYRINIVSHTQLVVHADRKTHEKILDLLAAFRRSLDVAVVVEYRLFDVDRAVYQRQVVAHMPRLPGNPPVFVHPATDETERQLLDGKLDTTPLALGKPLRTGKTTLPNRCPGNVFSWREAVPYERAPARVVEKSEMAVAFPGYSCSLTPEVSSDRRTTRLHFTLKVTELVEWQKVKALQLLPNQETRETFFEEPLLQETSFARMFSALDGWPVVVPIPWCRPGTRANDRQLLLVFSARILIEEEEREVQKQLKEQQRKLK